MAATFNFELVTPERLVFSGEATQVVVPGAEGDFAVLAGHAPVHLDAAARHPRGDAAAGQAAPAGQEGRRRGRSDRLTVLAQTAVPLEELHGARLAGELQLAEAQAAEAKDDHARMMAETLLDLLKRLQAEGRSKAYLRRLTSSAVPARRGGGAKRANSCTTSS